LDAVQNAQRLGACGPSAWPEYLFMNSSPHLPIAAAAILRWDRDVNVAFQCLRAPWTNAGTRFCVLVLGLFVPSICPAQKIGQVECSRPGDYIYLYTSMTTLDVRGTLQCGQQVEIIGRYDDFFAVRTAKGDTGYVPLDSLVLLKTDPAAKLTLPPTKEPAREKIYYDQPSKPADAPSNPPPSAHPFVLLDSTPVRLKLGKSISSADAQVGDEVSLEVSEDVVVDGLLVVAKGASAIGVINEAEPKKLLGRGGKLGVLLRSVRLADDEQVVLRSGGDGKGSSSTAGMMIPVVRGKDITFPQGTDFLAYVNGDTRLKRENFHAAPALSDDPPIGTVTNIPHRP